MSLEISEYLKIWNATYFEKYGMRYILIYNSYFKILFKNLKIYNINLLFLIIFFNYYYNFYHSV